MSPCVTTTDDVQYIAVSLLRDTYYEWTAFLCHVGRCGSLGVAKAMKYLDSWIDHFKTWTQIIKKHSGIVWSPGRTLSIRKSSYEACDPKIPLENWSSSFSFFINYLLLKISKIAREMDEECSDDEQCYGVVANSHCDHNSNPSACQCSPDYWAYNSSLCLFQQGT